MNQEAHVQDADTGSREFNLQIEGFELPGEYGAAGKAVLRVITELVPIAELIMEETPERSILLTDPGFWDSNGWPSTDGVNEAETAAGCWSPLDVGLDSATVRINPAAVLEAGPDGEAVWREDSSAKDLFEIHSFKYLKLSEGLLGLQDWRQFLLFFQSPEEPVGVLIPLAPYSVSLAIVDPFQVLPEYEPILGEAELLEIVGKADAPISYLAILNIQDDPFEVFVNLLGPLVYDPRTGRGKQVVLSNSGYSASYRLGQMAGME